MKNVKRNLAIQCGVYNTHYNLVIHRDSSLTVKRPFIKWIDNTGSLDFESICITDPDEAKNVIKFFEAQTHVLDCNTVGGLISLDDILDGDYNQGIKIF